MSAAPLKISDELAALSRAANALYDAINSAGNPDEIDKVMRAVWYRYYKGEINDDDAQ